MCLVNVDGVMRSHGTAKAILVLIVGFVIVVSAYWFFFARPYPNIVVSESQPKEVTINEVIYVFEKQNNFLDVYPWIESFDNETGLTNTQTGILNPTQGETYSWLGIDITIVEVHEDRYVISVSSRD